MLISFNAMRYQRATDNLLPVLSLLLLSFASCLAIGRQRFPVSRRGPRAQGEITGRDRDGGSFIGSPIRASWTSASRIPGAPFGRLIFPWMRGPARRTGRPIAHCRLRMTRERRIATFRDRQVLHFPILVRHGSNRFTLRILQPTDWQVRFPGDPREYMLQLQSLKLKPLLQ